MAHLRKNKLSSFKALLICSVYGNDSWDVMSQNTPTLHFFCGDFLIIKKLMYAVQNKKRPTRKKNQVCFNFTVFEQHRQCVKILTVSKSEFTHSFLPSVWRLQCSNIIRWTHLFMGIRVQTTYIYWISRRGRGMKCLHKERE